MLSSSRHLVPASTVLQLLSAESGCLPGHALAADLVIHVTGLADAQGQVGYALFDDEAAFDVDASSTEVALDVQVAP